MRMFLILASLSFDNNLPASDVLFRHPYRTMPAVAFLGSLYFFSWSQENMPRSQRMMG